MGGVTGINGLPPTPERPADARERKSTDAPAASQQDGVQISSEGQKAADTAKVFAVARKEPDIRPEKVAAAKAAIERGDYKLENRIAEVAKKLLKFL